MNENLQLFEANEVSPKTANQIGKELAEELWGDKYQVIICTHINKENVHNHLILNSVSFIDGKKYHNSANQESVREELLIGVSPATENRTTAWAVKPSRPWATMRR